MFHQYKNETWCPALCLQVFSIDYGHTGKVQCSELRLLHTNFAKMPAQGVHAQLSLKPAEGGEWHPMGRQLFVKLARRFIWSAEVVKIINPKVMLIDWLALKHNLLGQLFDPPLSLQGNLEKLSHHSHFDLWETGQSNPNTSVKEWWNPVK